MTENKQKLSKLLVCSFIGALIWVVSRVGILWLIGSLIPIGGRFDIFAVLDYMKGETINMIFYNFPVGFCYSYMFLTLNDVNKKLIYIIIIVITVISCGGECYFGGPFYLDSKGICLHESDIFKTYIAVPMIPIIYYLIDKIIYIINHDTNNTDE